MAPSAPLKTMSFLSSLLVFWWRSCLEEDRRCRDSAPPPPPEEHLAGLELACRLRFFFFFSDFFFFLCLLTFRVSLQLPPPGERGGGERPPPPASASTGKSSAPFSVMGGGLGVRILGRVGGKSSSVAGLAGVRAAFSTGGGGDSGLLASAFVGVTSGLRGGGTGDFLDVLPGGSSQL